MSGGKKSLWRDEDEGPLASPKILTKIINFCQPTFSELRNFRLVSRLWHEVTLDMWRCIATLKLLQDIPETPEVCSSSTLDSPTYQPQERIGVPMSEFLLNIVDPSDPHDLDYKPFQRVKLKGIDIEQEMEFTGATEGCDIVNVFPRIWDIIGALVKYLHCEECTFENTLKMGAFQKLVLEKSPFLEEFVMTNTIVLAPSWEQNPHLIIRYDYHINLTTLHIMGDFPMGLSNLLAYIPNIQELKVRNGSIPISSQDRHNFATVWVPFSNLRKFNKEHFRLKRLDVMHTDTFKITVNPTPHFRAANLPLEHLSVEISPYLDFGNNNATPVASTSRDTARLRGTEDILASIFREHVKTLKVFEVFRAPFSEPYANFPFGISLDDMKELHLWGNVTSTLNFLKCTPNLETLFMDTSCYEKWDEMRPLFEMEYPYEFQPYREDIVKNTGSFFAQMSFKMVSMKKLHLEFTLHPESIVQLSNWMPNLKSFGTILDKVSFRVVCSSMPNLEELRALFGSEVDNDTITGVAPGIPRDPYNITSFKKLKRFRLDAYCGKGVLKDSAVYLGFLRMNLYQLEICVSRQMSEKAEEELKAAVPVFRFIRNYGPEPHPDYDCCRRARFLRDFIKGLPGPTRQSATDRVLHM